MHLDNVSIRRKFSASSHAHIVLSWVLGKSPLETLEDLLTSGKLELSTTNRFDDVRLMGILGSDRNEDLSNANTGSNTNGLSVGVTHTGRQSIGSGTRKHFIGAKNVEWMRTDANVVIVLSNGLGQMLVDSDTAGLEGLGGHLLLLVSGEVRHKRKEIDRGLLGTDIENTNLSFWDTTAVARLDVRLVLLVTVAAGWTATHGEGVVRFCRNGNGGIEIMAR